MSRDQLWAAAREAWPSAKWSDPRAEELVRAALGEIEGLAAERLDDLLLAWACVLGDSAAVHTFESRYVADMIPNLRGMGLSRADIDEVLQRLRERLLVGGARSGPRLANYRGRGQLGGFVRTAAVRLAIELFRQSKPTEGQVPDFSEVVTADPELEYMRGLYSAELAQAVAAAWESIAAKQRLLLRYQLQDRLGIDAIAKLCSVHRATAARRCSAARRALVSETRRKLRSRLEVGGQTLDSILRLLESQIHLSLRCSA